MITTFIFTNGTSKLHLHPENARDEQYLSLCLDGKTNVSLEAVKDKDMIIVFAGGEKK